MRVSLERRAPVAAGVVRQDAEHAAALERRCGRPKHLTEKRMGQTAYEPARSVVPVQFGLLEQTEERVVSHARHLC